MKFALIIWSSLICDMSARRERRECDTSAAPVQDKRHKCHVNNKSLTRVQIFDFDNDTSEKIFSFLNRFIFFFLKGFIILEFVNFPQKIHHGWKLWRAINRKIKCLYSLFIPCSQKIILTLCVERFTKSR